MRAIQRPVADLCIHGEARWVPKETWSKNAAIFLQLYEKCQGAEPQKLQKAQKALVPPVLFVGYLDCAAR
jgi:hypothetical protein